MVIAPTLAKVLLHDHSSPKKTFAPAGHGLDHEAGLYFCHEIVLGIPYEAGLCICHGIALGVQHGIVLLVLHGLDLRVEHGISLGVLPMGLPSVPCSIPWA